MAMALVTAIQLTAPNLNPVHAGEEKSDSTKTTVKTVELNVEAGHGLFKFNFKKTTETKNMAVAPKNESEGPGNVTLKGSGPAHISGRQLITNLTTVAVKTSDTVNVSQESTLDPEVARALGYTEVVVLPAQYHLCQGNVLIMDVRTGKPLTDEASDRKLGVGVGFTTLNLGRSVEAKQGVGARVTYNIFDNLAVEAEVNSYSEKGQIFGRQGSGPLTQALFRMLPGRRFENFRVSGKLGAGITRFEHTIVSDRFDNGRLVGSNFGAVNRPTFDVGGVAEFFPSKAFSVRFDVSDILIRKPCPIFIPTGSPGPTFPTPPDGGTLGNPCGGTSPFPTGPLLLTAAGQRKDSVTHNVQTGISLQFGF